ncbi:MAG: DNA polymerase I [Actinobacteria bacterium]|nr:DNA polymerase I [Actinomycetota bacterium]
MLIDGNSLTYRAFFALPTDLATASGQVTNAVFGFTSMLVNLLRDHRPDGIAVAFDRPEPTFRHEAVTTYKAGRQEAPDILRQQMGLVRQVIETLHIPSLEQPGVEADDIIATLATRARDRGDEVIVVTGDRDAYQLVEDPLVKVLYNRRGVSDYVLYDEAGIRERTGVVPSSYVEYAALRGDPSDNLPGVPGVGEKTAAKLVNTYGGLDGVFGHASEQTPKLRQNLVEHEARARKNAEIMVLLRDLDLDVDLDDLVMGPLDAEEVRRLFDFLEFRTLWDRLVEAVGGDLGAAGPTTTDVLEAELAVLADAATAATMLDRLAAERGPLAVEPLFSGPPRWDADLRGLALVGDAATGEVLFVPASLLADERVARALAGLLGDRGRPLAAHEAKPLLAWALRSGACDPVLAIDTALAAYLLDPADARYHLPTLLLRYADLELPAGTEAPEGQLDFAAADGAPEAGTEAAQEAARRALAVARLAPRLLAALDSQGVRPLHDDIEVPLVAVLARMEVVGVGVDRPQLQELSDRLAGKVAELQDAIWADAGERFTINSTPQLRRILYDQLGLVPQKKTKTGYSTDAQSLAKLAGQHPIVDHLLAYREVEKLRSTYGEALLAEVRADGRIHATFNQTVARTGRLSSDQPNLHNIPVRTELGREFRAAFVPAEGCELLVADYNQIELRCIAHLAQDPGLIRAFTAGDDIHRITAARVFGVAPEDVDGAQRAKAKMVSYGLAYGMESYGLAQRLNIDVKEAAGILGAYFEAFPSVKAYMDRTVAEARERGYTETLFGRRRPIPELQAGNPRIRQAGERQAMNAGIQGLAADIFKVALVRLDAALREADMRSRLILQVHDEVLLEVPADERDPAAEVVLASMRRAAELSVPLEVNLGFGPSWADAK